MKRLRLISLAIICCLFLIPTQSSISQAYEDTQCFQCHTSAKQLIEITREIAKTRPALKSSETEGEG
jgi:hypothetical protein